MEPCPPATAKPDLRIWSPTEHTEYTEEILTEGTEGLI
jgi:hypothetical protein